MLTVEFYPLRDSGKTYAGTNSNHQHFDDCMHGLMSASRLRKQAEQGVLTICEALRRYGDDVR